MLLIWIRFMTCYFHFFGTIVRVVSFFLFLGIHQPLRIPVLFSTLSLCAGFHSASVTLRITNIWLPFLPQVQNWGHSHHFLCAQFLPPLVFDLCSFSISLYLFFISQFLQLSSSFPSICSLINCFFDRFIFTAFHKSILGAACGKSTEEEFFKCDVFVIYSVMSVVRQPILVPLCSASRKLCFSRSAAPNPKPPPWTGRLQWPHPYLQICRCGWEEFTAVSVRASHHWWPASYYHRSSHGGYVFMVP